MPAGSPAPSATTKERPSPPTTPEGVPTSSPAHPAAHYRGVDLVGSCPGAGTFPLRATASNPLDCQRGWLRWLLLSRPRKAGCIVAGSQLSRRERREPIGAPGRLSPVARPVGRRRRDPDPAAGRHLPWFCDGAPSKFRRAPLTAPFSTCDRRMYHVVIVALISMVTGLAIGIGSAALGQASFTAAASCAAALASSVGAGMSVVTHVSRHR
jgi:hypothetical protein